MPFLFKQESNLPCVDVNRVVRAIAHQVCIVDVVFDNTTAQDNNTRFE
jgi:hypothetical protein